MPTDDATLRAVLNANEDCPSCLLEQVEEVVASCSRDPALGILGFYASERASHSDAAMRHYEQIKDVPGVSYQVHADAGAIYAGADNAAAAMGAYKRSLALHPDPFVRLELAFLMRDNGMSDAAVEEFEKVMAETERARIDAKPGEVGVDAAYDDAMFALAELLRTRGDIGASRSVYRRYLEMFPHSSRAERALQALNSSVE